MGFASTADCTPDALKAARRRLQLAVHPDKVGQEPGANLAAGRVNKVCYNCYFVF
jgi:curved DNA-binding protein CbpA